MQIVRGREMESKGRRRGETGEGGFPFLNKEERGSFSQLRKKYRKNWIVFSLLDWFSQSAKVALASIDTRRLWMVMGTNYPRARG